VAWSNKSVSISSIARAAPVFDGSALWTDQSTRSMYMWGGQGPWGNLPKTKDLWKYSADDQSWEKQAASNVDFFMSIKRTVMSGITQCNDMGLFIGGYGGIWTDPSFAVGDISTPSPGMLSYNITSGIWDNESIVELVPSWIQRARSIHHDVHYVHSRFRKYTSHRSYVPLSPTNSGC
jgi:hypothetical protein